MKVRQFNKILKSVSDNKSGLVCPEKISLLDNSTKNEIISFLVKKRAAIVQEFTNIETDFDWLYSMGYLYFATTSSGIRLICTCENLPKLQPMHY